MHLQFGGNSWEFLFFSYKQDPWLWDLNWSIQNVKFLKKVKATTKRKKKVKASEINSEKEQSVEGSSDPEVCVVQYMNVTKKFYNSFTNMKTICS